MEHVIRIYTDGAASGNPGPGGYGIVMEYKSMRKEMSKGFRYTTNNRMELLSVVDALKSLKGTDISILIITDSKYVADAVEKKWVFGWEKKNFADKKNPDLWKEFLVLYRKYKIRIQWVRGHNGHPQNERCDELAVAASRGILEIDEYYEKIGSKS